MSTRPLHRWPASKHENSLIGLLKWNASIEMSNYNILINLAPNASRPQRHAGRSEEAGYAMAALLVGMSVMAIVLTAAMPTWSHMIRREKEEELIFRGTQYARAINQYQRKFANASPASLDVLIEQRLLRKKWKDPLGVDKESEFQMLYLSSGMGSRGPGPGQGSGARGMQTGIGIGQMTAPGRTSGPGGSGGTSGGTTYSTTPSGGIVGVASKNTGQSIKIYKDKQRYNEWQFIGMELSQQAGGPGGAAGGRGRGNGRGGFGDGRGGRGDGTGMSIERDSRGGATFRGTRETQPLPPRQSR